MGCDIHGWIERRIEGKWVAWKELKDRQRNYSRFTELASVRGESQNKPIGLPLDISETAKAHSDHDGADGHSHSWMPLRDAFEIFKNHGFRDPAEYYSEYSAFGIDINDDSEWLQYRLVFWFDN